MGNCVDTLDVGIDDVDNVELIGHGGSARVFRARQVNLDRWVAVKVITTGGSPDSARRFDRERRAMGQLSENPGIVPVYSTGLTRHGEPYLIMPYYAAGSLRRRLDDGPMPWREATELIISAAETIASAHETGILHLDLKPANILISTDGSPRIADFGIAKLMTEQSNTSDGSAFTPAYSAPEALRDANVSASSDIYGLASTLWALIAGKAPFRSEQDNSVLAIVSRVINNDVEDLRPAVPNSLWSVIERGMAKNPDDRYRTAAELASALRHAVSAPSGQLPSLGDPAPAPLIRFGHSAPRPAAVGAPHFEPTSRSTAEVAIPAMAAVVIALLVGGVVFLTFRSTQATSDIAAPPTITSTTASLPILLAPPFFATKGAEVSSGNPGTRSSPDKNLTSVSSTSESTSSMSSSTSSTPTTQSPISTTSPGPHVSGPNTTVSQTTPATSSSTSSSQTTTSTSDLPTTSLLDPIRAPSDVAASADDTGTVTLSWSPPLSGQSPTGYTITRDGSVLGETLDPSTYSITDNPPAGFHTYTVTSESSTTASATSPSVHVTVGDDGNPLAVDPIG